MIRSFLIGVRIMALFICIALVIGGPFFVAINRIEHGRGSVAEMIGAFVFGLLSFGGFFGVCQEL